MPRDGVERALPDLPALLSSPVSAKSLQGTPMSSKGRHIRSTRQSWLTHTMPFPICVGRVLLLYLGRLLQKASKPPSKGEPPN